MRPKHGGAAVGIGVGLAMMRFVGKAKLTLAASKALEPEPEPEPEPELEPEPGPGPEPGQGQPSVAGSLAALRFMGKARRKAAFSTAARNRAAEKVRAAGKTTVVTVEQQVLIAEQHLDEVKASVDIHHICAALKAARRLAQKHRVAKLKEKADHIEADLRERDKLVAFKIRARHSTVLLTEIKRLWYLARQVRPDLDSHDGLAKARYSALHVCIDKAVSEKGWTHSAAQDIANEDWVDDVARFSDDASITAWFTKVKGVLLQRSEPIVAKHGWQMVFQKFDTDGGGTLDVAEFRTAMRNFGVAEGDADDEDLADLFTAADDDGSGMLDGKEFGAWITGLELKRDEYKSVGLQLDKASRLSLQTIDNVRDCFADDIRSLGWSRLFNQFDTDGSGELDEDEFLHALRHICCVTTADVGDRELREVFKIIDEDGGGTLSSEEFVKALRSKQLETDSYRMTFEAFAMSMFEFLDYWASESTTAAYLRLLRGLFRTIASVEPHVKADGPERWQQPICDEVTGRFNYKLKHWSDIESLVSHGKLVLQSDTETVRRGPPRVAYLVDALAKKKRALKISGDDSRRVHRAMHHPVILSLNTDSNKQAPTPTPAVHDGHLTVRYTGAARRGWFFHRVAQEAFTDYENKHCKQPKIGFEALLLHSKAGEAFVQALHDQTSYASSTATSQGTSRIDDRRLYELQGALVVTIQAICYLQHELDSVCTCGSLDCRTCSSRRQTDRPQMSTSQDSSRSQKAPLARNVRRAWRSTSATQPRQSMFSIDSTKLPPNKTMSRSEHYSTCTQSPQPPSSARPVSARTYAEHRKIRRSRRSVDARCRALAHVEDYHSSATTPAFDVDTVARTEIGSTGVVMPSPPSHSPGQTMRTMKVNKPCWLRFGTGAYGWTPEMFLAESTKAHFLWIQAEAATRLYELKQLQARTQSPGSNVIPAAGAPANQHSGVNVDHPGHTFDTNDTMSSLKYEYTPAEHTAVHNVEDQRNVKGNQSDYIVKAEQVAVDKVEDHSVVKNEQSDPVVKTEQALVHTVDLEDHRVVRNEQSNHVVKAEQAVVNTVEDHRVVKTERQERGVKGEHVTIDRVEDHRVVRNEESQHVVKAEQAVVNTAEDRSIPTEDTTVDKVEADMLTEEEHDGAGDVEAGCIAKDQWTVEGDEQANVLQIKEPDPEVAAATLIQASFRRRAAVKKMQSLRRLASKHDKLHKMQCLKNSVDAIFAHMDINQDTIITLDEISSAVDKVGSSLQPPEVASAIASILSEDSGIDRDNFERWWVNHKELTGALFGQMLAQVQSTTAKSSKIWTKEDSVASLLQSSFLMHHTRKAVKKAAKFVSKASADTSKPEVDREHFEKFDADRTGRLDLQEMTDLMQSLGFQPDDGSARFMMEKYDDDGSGTICFEEFKELWRGIGLLGSEDILRILRKNYRSDNDLAALRDKFACVPFMHHNFDTDFKKTQACGYLKLHSCPCGTTLFTEGDVGDTLYIILSGSVECTVAGAIPSATVRLVCGSGDCVGEQSIKGMNEGRRDATVRSLEDSRFATMSRADYLRLTDTFTIEVMKVLRLRQGYERNRLALNLLRNFFHGTLFFQNLHFALIQYRCCGIMTLVQTSLGKVLYQQNTTGDSCYIMLEGVVGAFRKSSAEKNQRKSIGRGALINEYTPGMSFGENTVTGRTNKDRLRTETIAALSADTAYLARILAKDYIMVTRKVERQICDILKMLPRDRKSKDIDILCEFFEDEEFFKALQLDGVRRQCCRSMILKSFSAGDVLENQGDEGELFYVLIRGTVNIVINGKTVRQMKDGASFGELSLLGATKLERKRTATITAESKCVCATLNREEYRSLHHQEELRFWITKFWVLATTKLSKGGAVVDWRTYKKLHEEIAKATAGKKYNPKKASKMARKDWVADLNRHNKGGDSLDYDQFSNSMLEMLDANTSRKTMLAYMEFARNLFQKVAVSLRGQKQVKKNVATNAKHVAATNVKTFTAVQEMQQMRASVLDNYAHTDNHGTGACAHDVASERQANEEPGPGPTPKLTIPTTKSRTETPNDEQVEVNEVEHSNEESRTFFTAAKEQRDSEPIVGWQSDAELVADSCTRQDDTPGSAGSESAPQTAELQSSDKKQKRQDPATNAKDDADHGTGACAHDVASERQANEEPGPGPTPKLTIPTTKSRTETPNDEQVEVNEVEHSNEESRTFFTAAKEQRDSEPIVGWQSDAELVADSRTRQDDTPGSAGSESAPQTAELQSSDKKQKRQDPAILAKSIIANAEVMRRQYIGDDDSAVLGEMVRMYEAALTLLREGLSRGRYSPARHRTVAARAATVRKRHTDLQTRLEAARDTRPHADRAPKPERAHRLRATHCWTGTATLEWPPISPPTSPDHSVHRPVITPAVRPASTSLRTEHGFVQTPQRLALTATEQVFAKMRWAS